SVGVFGPSNVFSPFCNADTTAPVDPRFTSCVFGSAGNAFHVTGPTTPCGVRLFPSWNDLTRSCVVVPELTSIPEQYSSFIIRRGIGTRRTSRPVDPIANLGPLFMTSSMSQGRAPVHLSWPEFLPGHGKRQ